MTRQSGVPGRGTCKGRALAVRTCGGCWSGVRESSEQSGTPRPNPAIRHLTQAASQAVRRNDHTGAAENAPAKSRGARESPQAASPP